MLTDTQARHLAQKFGTPLWVMDAPTMRQRLHSLQAFETVRYAQKANPNVHLLRLLREGGAKVDAVSRGEALRALAAGFAGGSARAPSLAEAAQADIVYTADLLDRETLEFVVAEGLVVNCGSGTSFGPAWRLAAPEPGLWAWPQQEDQHGWRAQQARHLAR